MLAATWTPTFGQGIVINEFLASNQGTFVDDDGDAADWIELRNEGAVPVSLDGWYLTDDPANLTLWRFPAVEIAAGGFLVVFASGKDRTDPGLPLHTNFSLDSDGEFLALIRPDGRTPEHGFAPKFPPQHSDISYGLFAETDRLVATDSPVDVLVPPDNALSDTWTAPGFAPGAGWTQGTGGVGFYAAEGGELSPDTVGYWPLDGGLDDLARGNDGTYRGGTSPDYTAGFDGTAQSAVTFGGSDYLELGTADGLPVFNEAEFTVAMWVKGLPQSDNRVYSEGSTSNNNPLFTIGTDNGGNTGVVDIYIRSDSGSTVVNHAHSSRVAFDGTWHHIAWVDRSGSVTLYIDGEADGTNFNYSKPQLSLDVVSVASVLRSSACCFFTGSIDEIGVWNVALTEGEVADLAAGATPGAGNFYQDLLGTDIGADMQDVNSTAYLRFPFSVDDPARFESLDLDVQYDDGFVAYLNGREVARRNAPAAAGWNAAATAEREPREARAIEHIPLAEHLDALDAGDNVLAIHGLNSSAADSDFLVRVQLVATAASTFEARYFRTPSPGAANVGGVIDFVEDTKFTVDRGFFDEPFWLEISTATEGATIRYTTDQSAPTATRGTVYDGPIWIDGTTTVRAAAFKDGYEPTNIDTHTFIFLDDVLAQPDRPAGYPTEWQGWPADYAMDPEICTNTGSPHYDPRVKDALLSLPTLSLVVDRNDLMGASSGIYTHSLSRGVSWERPCSAELIIPDGSEKGFHVNCGIRMQGGSSARPGEGKHSFRLLFKSMYGPSKLRYPLFKDSPVESFDTLVLRCFSTDSWHFKDGGSRYRRWDSQFIRDLWMKDTQLAMGQLSGHNTYVHLYVNGLYWGVYNPSERPDDSFQASYQGDREEDWDILKDFNELFRGNRDSWNQLMGQAAAGLGSTAAYQRVQGNNPDGTRNPGYPVLLDVDNLIDYMILHLYACSEDWPHHNWYGARSRTGNLGGWRFFVWDQEIVMDFVFRNRINVNNDNSPARVYASLRANPDFRLRFADHVQKHLFNGGVLSDEGARKIWMRRAAEIDLAVIGESARWGDYRVDVPDPSHSAAVLYTREDHWLVEREKVLNEYIPESHRLALERFRAGGLYPDVDPPSLSQHGGLITVPFNLNVTAAAGTVYYTLDGTDPRLPGGGVSPTALVAGEAGREVVVPAATPCRAFVPASDALGSSWTEKDFDDATWFDGNTGVGYERTSGYEDLIGLDLQDELDGINASVYIRVPFNADSPGDLGDLTLRVKYDDGFVAYLNGVEVARANAPADLQWNSEATDPHSDADAVVFQSFNLGAASDLLDAGANVLAIQGLNSSPTSSDMVILPELSSVHSVGTGIELAETTRVKARAFDGSWSALSDAFFYLDLPLRITEVMYHPLPPDPESLLDADDFEFVELQNVGDAVLDLDGYRITGGIEFDFTGTGVRLLPGETVLLVKSFLAFDERYPGLSVQAVGPYKGKLGNAGDSVRLEGPAGEPILDFTYDDRWYPETDGLGRSLVTADALAARSAWETVDGWRQSSDLHGSPGVVESGPGPTSGWQLPGDVNQDAKLDLSDAVGILFALFLGNDNPLPCEGPVGSGGNFLLYNINGDPDVNLTDAIYLLNYLFLGGSAPALGTECVRIDGCPSVCR